MIKSNSILSKANKGYFLCISEMVCLKIRVLKSFRAARI